MYFSTSASYASFYQLLLTRCHVSLLYSIQNANTDRHSNNKPQEYNQILNTFSPAALSTLKSTVPGHFTTLWKSRSTSTPSGQLAQEAAEYYYSARPESVNAELNSCAVKHRQCSSKEEGRQSNTTFPPPYTVFLIHNGDASTQTAFVFYFP
jgi:hypothetical protein